MWTAEQERIRHYFATTHRRATSLAQTTIQRIGSDPSLDEVKSILDERSGLRGSYHNMEDELDDFINFDEQFVDSPRFYIELISLARKTSKSVDEALSISLEYLSNVSDVGDVFQDSLVSCLELSSQIANLDDTARTLSQSETNKLAGLVTRLAGTLKRMENHWNDLSDEIKAREDTVIFSELDSVVQIARLATENLPSCWRTYRATSTYPNQVMQKSLGGNTGTVPDEIGNNSATFPTRTTVTPTKPGERDIAKRINTTPGNLFLNGGVEDYAHLDEDERDGLRRIAETFESVRSEMATAWNKAMVHIDDEVVFTRLNTLMSVAKEATNKVIEATLRAEENAVRRLQTADELERLRYADKNRPLHPFPESTHLTPARRVHERGEDPQPIVQEAINVKRLETRSSSSAHPRHPVPTDNTNTSTQKPSPAMPALEDANVRFRYCNMEVFLPPEPTAKLIQTFAPKDENWSPLVHHEEAAHPLDEVGSLTNRDWKWEHVEYGRWTCQFDDAEIQGPPSRERDKTSPPRPAAKLIQTLPRFDHNTTAPPRVIELAINNNNWPKTFKTMRRPERGKTRKGNSTKQTSNMGSHSKNKKPDKNHPDPLAALITRKRLREIANRRRQENNNSKEHPLLDLGVIHHTHPDKQHLQATGSKLSQCGTCGVWAHILRCDHNEDPETPAVDGNDNTNPPPTSRNRQGVVHIDSDALPHHEYFEEATEAVTEDYSESGESDTSDDDGHRECGLGGYKNCPDNPTRHSTSSEEDNSDESDGDDDKTTEGHAYGSDEQEAAPVGNRETNPPYRTHYSNSDPPTGERTTGATAGGSGAGTHNTETETTRYFSWLPTHPGERLQQSIGSKLLQCDTCGRWAYGARCNHTKTPLTPPVDGNDNIRAPQKNRANSDGVQPSNILLQTVQTLHRSGSQPWIMGKRPDTQQPNGHSDSSDDNGGEELKCYEQYPDNLKKPIRDRPRGQIQAAKQEGRSQSKP